jgi:hypothetical protein
MLAMEGTLSIAIDNHKLIIFIYSIGKGGVAAGSRHAARFAAVIQSPLGN